MFGYVTPCNMELKVKDFEKFKAYYCGLCHAIKEGYGNLPRLLLNYDMTFLASLLGSMDGDAKYKKAFCLRHPLKKVIIAYDSKALNYAASANYYLALYKLLDDFNDDKNLFKKIFYLILKTYEKKETLNFPKEIVEKELINLSKLEMKKETSLDEIAEPFARLTGIVISSYIDNEYKDTLYELGYNLGKWIYIIDAFDDLFNDFKKGSPNPIINIYGESFLKNKNEYDNIKKDIDFNLVFCANSCLNAFKKLKINGDGALTHNILQLGLLEKMDIVYTRSEKRYE